MTDPTTNEPSSGPIAPRVQRPAVNRMVWYTDPQFAGGYRSAIVVGTVASVGPGEAAPPPTGDMNAHLYVIPPAGSAYHAHDVAYDADGAAGTWRWPTRDET
jgi:hypothetical protein